MTLMESHVLLWLLQENYYRPPDQDACLPCDCFPHGSHSRACDMDTGQCVCKSGVIGRQCNRCDNPFAEVTTLGCEGLSCPLIPSGHTAGTDGWAPACVLVSACVPHTSWGLGSDPQPGGLMVFTWPSVDLALLEVMGQSLGPTLPRSNTDVGKMWGSGSWGGAEDVESPAPLWAWPCPAEQPSFPP